MATHPNSAHRTILRLTTVAALTIAAGTTLASCSSASGNGATATDGADGKITVGYVNGQGIAQFPFYQRLVDGIEASAEENGNVEVVVLDARGDAATEAANIQQMILREVDALIYTPGSVDGGATLAKKAMDAGLPVIAVDQVAGDTTAYIGYDNKKLGEAMAECVADGLGGKGKVAGQPGILGTVATDQRLEGWKEVFAKYPDITYGPEIANNYDPGEAFSITQDIITSNPDIDAIMTMDDTSAMGVVRAVEGTGKDIFIQGLALNNEAMESLRNDGLSCDVYMSPYDMGVKSVETAWAATQNEEFEARPELPYPTVTKENVDEIAEQEGAGW